MLKGFADQFTELSDFYFCNKENEVSARLAIR
jgi:hypothetical protein